MLFRGHILDFTRRRYGKSSYYTWIYVKIGEKWQSTGDPLPRRKPTDAELADAIERAYRHYEADRQKINEIQPQENK